MTGKTHAMVGMAATLAFIPVTIPKLSFTLTELGKMATQVKGLLSLGFLFIVVWIASRLPDIDQPGSKISVEVAGPFGANRVFALIGGLLFVYISKHPDLIHLPDRYATVPLYIGIALIIMAMLKHRGITHSIWGAMIAWYAFNSLQDTSIYQTYIHQDLSLVFILCYGMHILVDMCSDEGVFLFYIPFIPATHKRIRIPTFIRTDSFLDVIVVRLGSFFFIAYSVIYKLMIGG